MLSNLALFCLATVLATFQKIGQYFPNHLVTMKVNYFIFYQFSYESRLGALADLELALRIKGSSPNLEHEDFMVVAGDMLFQV